MPGCTSPIPRPDDFSALWKATGCVCFEFVIRYVIILVSTLWRYSLVSQYLRFGNQYVYIIIYIYYTHIVMYNMI